VHGTPRPEGRGKGRKRSSEASRLPPKARLGLPCIGSIGNSFPPRRRRRRRNPSSESCRERRWPGGLPARCLWDFVAQGLGFYSKHPDETNPQGGGRSERRPGIASARHRLSSSRREGAGEAEAGGAALLLHLPWARAAGWKLLIVVFNPDIYHFQLQMPQKTPLWRPGILSHGEQRPGRPLDLRPNSRLCLRPGGKTRAASSGPAARSGSAAFSTARPQPGSRHRSGSSSRSASPRLSIDFWASAERPDSGAGIGSAEQWSRDPRPEPGPRAMRFEHPTPRGPDRCGRVRALGPAGVLLLSSAPRFALSQEARAGPTR